MRIIATGLSVGILFDAIVVRTLLLPALVALLDRWTVVLGLVAAATWKADQPPGNAFSAVG